HTYSVRSGSMTPTINAGDLVVARSISPTEAQVGDIVTFKDPDGSDRLISHRVRAVHERHGRAYFVTRGDGNNAVERWNVPDSGTIGRIVSRVPKLGYLLGQAESGPGKIVVVLLPALILLALALIRIWAPQGFHDRPEGLKA